MAINLAGIGVAFKHHWEKVLLLIVLLGLIVSGAILYWNITQWEEDQWGIPQRAAEAGADPVDIALFETFTAQLENPELQRLGDYDLFIGPKAILDLKTKRLIPKNVRREGDDDADGMPNDWEIEMGLNYQDPRDAFLDPDQDGFSNLEEYLAGTDPFNSEDRPPPAAKLRLYQTRYRNFQLLFQSYMPTPQGEGLVFQINFGGRTEFHKLGDQVGDYRITDFQERSTTRTDPTTGQEVEAKNPVLIVQKGTETIELPYQQRIPQQDPRAQLMMLIPPRPRLMPKLYAIGESFTFGERTYKVIDIQEMEVRLQDVEANQEFTIPQYTSQDLRSLQGPGAVNQAQPNTGGATMGRTR